MSTETPETDEAFRKTLLNDFMGRPVVRADFARRLERERDLAIKERDEARRERDQNTFLVHDGLIDAIGYVPPGRVVKGGIEASFETALKVVNAIKNKSYDERDAARAEAAELRERVERLSSILSGGYAQGSNGLVVNRQEAEQSLAETEPKGEA